MIRWIQALIVSFLALQLIGCASPSAPQADDDVLSIDDTAVENAGGEDGETDAIEEEFDVQEPAQEKAQSEEKPQDEDLTKEFEEQAVTQAPEPEPTVLTPAPAEPVSVVNIQDIKYLANQSGGSVVVEADGPMSYKTRLNKDTNQFVLEIENAQLPSQLKRPFIMKEFSGAFGAINAYQQPGGTTARVVIQIKADASGEPTISQEGNSLIVIPTQFIPVAEKKEDKAPEGDSINESKAAQDEKLLAARSLNEFLTGQSNYYGREISLQVKDADIRDVLNFIADESGMNMVISDDVTGKISMKLRKIPWDQALITVMRAKKLGYLRQGNVIRISTLDLLQQESDSARRIIESQKALVPVRVRVIPVSYAAVEDLTKQVGSFLSKDRGSVTADPRTSSLIVTDTDENLEKISRLVKELDVPPAQVMIEGKIVEASEDFQDSIGINWGMSGAPVNLSSSGGFAGGPIDFSQSLSVANVGGDAAAGILSFNMNLGTLDVLGNLNASLALAERNSMVKILSSPRIVTMNKEKAKITQQSQQVTITQVKDQQGNVTKGVSRDPIVVDLTVTPQITSDGAVIMDVEVKREFAGALVDQETQARAVNSRTAKTKILIKNAQTAVIGGIYQSDSNEGESGVPVLKDIPVLGWLFKSRTRQRVKNELLIFLTPKILNLKDQIADLTS